MNVHTGLAGGRCPESSACASRFLPFVRSEKRGISPFVTEATDPVGAGGRQECEDSGSVKGA